ncbi:putative cation transport regulator ChaB [Zymobacter palmae]|nr:putative cation transport regulator ChaB [Zymobacter palmae]
MPYPTRDSLPDSVRHVLPPHAQDIYREAFNHAYAEYADEEDRHGGDSREQTAHRVAWAAVKHCYEKGSDGHWHSRH